MRNHTQLTREEGGDNAKLRTLVERQTSYVMNGKPSGGIVDEALRRVLDFIDHPKKIHNFYTQEKNV